MENLLKGSEMVANFKSEPQLYYKVVWAENKKLYSHSFLRGNCSVRYIKDKFVFPKIQNSKLFVFDSLSNAKDFVHFHGCEESRIYACECVNPVKAKTVCMQPNDIVALNTFWNYVNTVPPSTVSYYAPIGSYYCDAVKLVKRVHKGKVKINV